MTEKDTRSPRRVYSVGDDPDPRFSFANERTFLAWIRTSLALIAAGVALDMFGGSTDETARSWLAGVIIAVGVLSSLGAYVKWMAAERAMRSRLSSRRFQPSSPKVGRVSYPARPDTADSTRTSACVAS